MAVQVQGVFGSFSGKVGKVVGTSWRGMPILRSAPKETTKKPSTAQLVQRAKFSAAMSFLNPIKPFLKARFGKMEGSKSPFDLALSYHLKEAIKVVDDTLVLDYPKMCLSKGHLSGLEGASASLESGNILRVQWINNSDQSFASANDMLTIALYVPSSALFYFFENVAPREDTSAQITLPAEATATEVHCWATFVTVDGLQTATSRYIFF